MRGCPIARPAAAWGYDPLRLVTLRHSLASNLPTVETPELVSIPNGPRSPNGGGQRESQQPPRIAHGGRLASLANGADPVTNPGQLHRSGPTRWVMRVEHPRREHAVMLAH